MMLSNTEAPTARQLVGIARTMFATASLLVLALVLDLYRLSGGHALAPSYVPPAIVETSQAARIASEPLPDHVYDKVKQYARLGNAEHLNHADLATRCTSFGSLFSEKTMYHAPPFEPVVSNTVMAGICVNRIVSRWDTLEDPVDGPRWGVSPVGATWGAPAKVVLTHTASGTKEGKSHTIPLTSVLWFDAHGRIESSWDFFLGAPYPVES